MRQPLNPATEEGECFHTGFETTGQAYRGKEAKAAIVGRLAGWTKPQALAASISDFYGDALRFRESPALPSSLYEINLRHQPVGLQYVLVELRLGTNRMAESLSHELLHVGLSSRGYPLPERVSIPLRLVPWASYLIDILSIVQNLLEHELMFDAFRRLGFDDFRFLSELPAPPDYEGIAAVSSSLFAEAVEFPWWCVEYLRHWLSARQGLDSVALAYADKAIYWGSGVYPSLKDARLITGLVESGMLADSKTYPACVNRILEVMRLPGYSQWVIMERGTGGKPSVREWNKALQT